MDVFEPGFCLYDDPDLPEGGDADADSPMLRDAASPPLEQVPAIKRMP